MKAKRDTQDEMKTLMFVKMGMEQIKMNFVRIKERLLVAFLG